ncbi:MAG: DUF4336 domain-containing protein [Methylobacter sp.]|nr:DUF4336 domain-containing protein [Methylobacter sp.]
MIQDNIELYEPINIPKSIDDNIWIVDGPLVKMAMYKALIPFPTRMTIIHLSNGDLWCHSPIALTEAIKSKIDRLGPVRHLVSPNKIHYIHINSWMQAYPEATAWASPGVRDRAANQGIALTFNADLSETPPPVWADDIDQLIFRGSRFMDEVVFFHKRTSTLILADLIENFEPKKVGWLYRVLLRLAGAADPDGKAPLDLRITFWGRKIQAYQGYQRILKWKPGRIILSHGRWYESNGIDELKRAFRWLT